MTPGAGRRGRRGLRAPPVLVLSRVIPGEDSSGGERRLVRIAAMLAERADVDLVAAGTSRPEDESARIRSLRIDHAVRVPYGGRAVHLSRLLMGRRYRLILAESWELAELALPLVRRHQPGAVFVVDSVDLHFLRDARAAETVGQWDPGQSSSAVRELDTYHGADVRIFVSDVERELYESLAGAVTEHNVVIPIVVDEAARPARTPRPGEVVFVGPLWHAPNLDGVTWFCTDVWPQVRDNIPKAEFRLIGSNAWSVPVDTSPFTDCPGVTAEGFVPDLGPVYASAAVAVAPLRFGAGMKAKVCDAMAAGVPIVTTTVGAEGIRAVPGQDLLVADDPTEFALAVASVLGDSSRAASIGAAGGVAVRRQCGADVVRPAVHSLLDEPVKPDGSAMTSSRTRQLPRIVLAGGWRLARRVQTLCQQGGR